jgi:hypothetical protein
MLSLLLIVLVRLGLLHMKLQKEMDTQITLLFRRILFLAQLLLKVHLVQAIAVLAVLLLGLQVLAEYRMVELMVFLPLQPDRPLN